MSVLLCADKSLLLEAAISHLWTSRKKPFSLKHLPICVYPSRIQKTCLIHFLSGQFSFYLQEQKLASVTIKKGVYWKDSNETEKRERENERERGKGSENEQEGKKREK